jgi:hypothetical protein
MMRDLRLKRLDYGIAIDAQRFVALPANAHGAEPFSRDLSPDGSGSQWPDLAQAFEQFRAHVEGHSVRASIALMPSLVRVRAIELPFMRRGELLHVLQRDANRFFFGVRDEQVVAVRHVERSRSRRTVLAAAAPRWLIELLASQDSATFHIDRIVPAHAAWAAAVATMKTPQRARWLGVPCGDALELLELRGSKINQVRRVRSAGDESLVASITGALPAAITSLTRNEPAIQIAARNASSASILSLIAPSVLLRERYWARRQVHWLLSAAATLLMTSAVLRLVDINRELAHTESRRASIRGQVSEAMRVRTAVSTIERRLQLLAEIREQTARRSDAFVILAGHLPLDAYLAEVAMSGDSLTLKGAADRASDVFQQLREAPGVIALRATAPIRQETRPDQSSTEFFSLTVRLAAPEHIARQR